MDDLLNEVEGKPIVFEFFQVGCAPCADFARAYQNLKDENPEAVFKYVNALDHMEMAMALDIRYTPTFVVWVNSE